MSKYYCVSNWIRFYRVIRKPVNVIKCLFDCVKLLSALLFRFHEISFTLVAIYHLGIITAEETHG